MVHLGPVRLHCPQPKPEVKTKSGSILGSGWFWAATVVVVGGAAAGGYFLLRPDDPTTGTFGPGAIDF